MIMVFIDSLDASGEQHRFGFGGQSLEQSLDTVSRLVGTGAILLRVELIDNGSSPMLSPVEVFDGSSVLEPIRSLQQQWQAQLATAG